jgi:hypothetical protein
MPKWRLWSRPPLGMSSQPVTVVLEDFGVFLALPLMNMYKHLIPRGWKTLDVIEKTEETIHHVVRVQTPGAKPPVLQTIRRSEDEVVLIYGSPRKLCSLAIGIARGVAKQFNETIEVTQTKCMHNGAPHCEIVFRKGWEVLITKTLRGMVAWTNWRNQMG